MKNENNKSWLSNIIVSSNLNKKTKLYFVHILNKYGDISYGYCSVGEIHRSIDNLKILENEITDLNLEDDIYYSLVYSVVRHHCYKEDTVFKFIINQYLENEKLRTELYTIKNSKVSMIIFLSQLTPYINELDSLMTEEKSFLVMKKYQEILTYCYYEGVDSKLLEQDKEEELKEKLSSLFFEYSTLQNPKLYKKWLKEKKVHNESKTKEEFTAIKTHNAEGYILQKLLYTKMLEYNNKTNCMTKIYNKDINLYYLDNIIIVAYKYDDVPNIVLKSKTHTYSWEDRDFWAKIFDSNMDFITNQEFNYFIPEKLEMFKVIPLALTEFYSNYLGKRVIIAPEEYIEEALINNLTENNTILLDFIISAKLKDYGIDVYSETDKLLTSDGNFYFKNPKLVDELNVKDITKYEHLHMIKSKTDETSRNRTIGAIKAAAKRNPKKPDPIKKQVFEKGRTVSIENIRLPYKDN